MRKEMENELAAMDACVAAADIARGRSDQSFPAWRLAELYHAELDDLKETRRDLAETLAEEIAGDLGLKKN